MRTGFPQPTVEPGRQSGRMFDATPDRINWLQHCTPLPPSCPELVARAKKKVKESEAELKEQEEQDIFEKSKATPRLQPSTATGGRSRPDGSIREHFSKNNIVSLF